MRITLLLVSFLLCYYCIYITDASIKCLEDQQSLLLQFKNNLTFDPVNSTKLLEWNNSTDCCNWISVTCDYEGHVIGLDLRGELISGRFNDSSSLFNLQHLQTLDLSYNNFNSSFPSGFSKLNKLTTLDLSSSHFYGTLSNSMSNLTHLTYLELSHNDLSGAIPSSLFTLPSLEDIYLDDNQFIKLDEFLNVSSFLLRNLDLSYNNLLGPFPISIFHLKSLIFLDLSYNKFNGSLHLHKFLELKNLNFLDISHNKLFLNGNPINVQPSSFPTFGYLSLASCNLKTFPSFLINQSSLTTLDLSNNQIQGVLPNWIRKYGSVTHFLYLSHNNLHGSIPNFICNVSNLEVLDLSFNNFSGSIPSCLMTILENLMVLNLRRNNLQGPIPDKFSASCALETLDLNGNSLHGPVPKSLAHCSELHVLDIGTNQIDGRFPCFLQNLPRLSILVLRENKFHGTLGCSKAKNPWQMIQFVDIAFNNFSGKLPQKYFRTMKKMRYDNHNVDPDFTHLGSKGLHYRDNMTVVTKGQPMELVEILTIFTSIDFSSNHFEGVIPKDLMNLKALNILNFSNNAFSGEIPSTIGNLKQLESLDLSNNFLVGEIPMQLASLPFLSYLNLFFNHFVGKIPSFICNASNPYVLDFSFNNFSGSIPSCLMRMTETLKVLNLRGNRLQGPIPDKFPASCSLQTLNLNGNLLHGPIPKSLAHCSELEVLDIGFNQIDGRFPCFLQNIRRLSVLVLRNNKFHGTLRCSKAKNPWQMIQIVDIAFNNFRGNLPGKYFRTLKKMRHVDHNVGPDFIHCEFHGIYYQDSVTVMSKGRSMELVKILTIYTTIDFSSNHFEGQIPEDLMDLKELYALNFSNNAFSGKIPLTIGNLKQLESLDLSNNSLVGEIPMQLASLSFLSYLNLSFNHLVGKIPTGTQLQSFEASSFEGNYGLYGPPLTETPNGTRQDELHPQPPCGRLTCSIEWNFLSVELGFVFGLGIIIGPIMFWKQWRVRYWKVVDKILCWMFSRIYLEYATDRGQTYTVLRW
ncbi:receptor protein [Trifolium repens]|nr:receptor protein [Trifolium repens]